MVYDNRQIYADRGWDGERVWLTSLPTEFLWSDAIVSGVFIVWICICAEIL